MGSSDHFILEIGNYTALSCPRGTYQPNEGQGSCISCGAGNMCPFLNMSSVETCKAGHYCPDGEPTPCPAGTYGNSTGLSSIDMCTDCPSGSYCQVGLFKAAAIQVAVCWTLVFPQISHSSEHRSQ